MPSDDDFVPPEQFDEHRLIRPLGKGAMGQVYLCHDIKLDRRVAVKFIRHLDADAEARKRFETEARAIARLDAHANVVAVYRLGECAGRPYLVSQYISGQSLDSLQRPVPWQNALRIAIGLSRGLAFAHRRRVLHRDIKPANIMLTEDGQVKLLDFGLAKLLDAGSRTSGPSSSQLALSPVMRSRDRDRDPELDKDRDRSPRALAETADFAALRETPRDRPEASPSIATTDRNERNAQLTATGNMMGTPLYMSPEVWRGDHATVHSDIYSLGAVLYELVSGVPPHQAEALATLQLAVLSEPVQPLAQRVPSVDPRFAEIVDRCLCMNAEDRFASADALCSELEALAATVAGTTTTGSVAPVRPAGRRRLFLGIAGLASALIVGLSSFGAYRIIHRPPEMIEIPGGKFLMGSTAKEIESAWEWCGLEDKMGCPRDLYEREQPLREVTISSFRMDRTEVTQAHFVRWLNSQKNLYLEDNRWVHAGSTVLANIYPTFRPSHGVVFDAKRGRYAVLPGYERQPVVQVTWDGAQRFCQSYGKRLPTEAEWEYAARGPQSRRFPWGNDEPHCDGVVMATADEMNCAGQRTGAPIGPRDVGTASQDRSPEGVHDLGGNVSEWVADAFVDRYPVCQSPCVNPEVSPEVAALLNHAGSAEKPAPLERAFRGGNWHLASSVTRAAARSRWPQSVGAVSIGFRCVANRQR